MEAKRWWRPIVRAGLSIKSARQPGQVGAPFPLTVIGTEAQTALPATRIGAKRRRGLARMIWSQRDDYLTPISGAMSGERCKARPGKHIHLCAHPYPWQAPASDIGKRQMRNRVFHQARIAGVMFEGIMTGSGPTLSCQMNGSVALGVSGLRQFQPEALGSRRPPPPGWWVVKYCIEERIFLPDFDRAAIRELSDEFGLVVLADGRSIRPTASASTTSSPPPPGMRYASG